MLWLARGVGTLAALFILVGVLMSLSGLDTRHKFEMVERPEQCPPAPAKDAAPASSNKLPGGFEGHVIAMELVRSKCDIAAIIGDLTHGNRAAMRWQLTLDTYLLIPVYWLLYTTLAVLLFQRPSHWARWLGAVVIVCGTAVALLDLAENARIGEALALSLSATTDLMAYAIREASLLKWALSFVTTGVLASIFFLADSFFVRTPDRAVKWHLFRGRRRRRLLLFVEQSPHQLDDSAFRNRFGGLNHALVQISTSVTAELNAPATTIPTENFDIVRGI